MKTKVLTIIIADVIFLGVSSVYADIVVLDFESLSTPGTGYSHLGPLYTEDGFNLESIPSERLYYYHRDDVNFPGSTALFHLQFPGGITYSMLTHTGNFTFDLLSIELSEGHPYMSGPLVTFIGTKSDNSTVTASLTLDGVFGFETFTPQGFTDLTALRLTHNNIYFNSFQYDNVTLNVIPEPSALLLFSFGGLFLRSIHQIKACNTLEIIDLQT